MSNIKHYSISLDSWTSLANRGYLAVTTHGITKSFVFESFLLDIVAVKKSETSKHIAELVEDILERWDIPLHAVVAGTSDGAANAKKVLIRNINIRKG